MPNILISNNFYQGTSQSCIIDLIAPTFAGLLTASVQSRGQIRATWAAATEATSNPVRYEVYVQASTGVGLFNLANVIGITDKLQLDFWQTPDGAFLVNGTTYFVGVRAVDAVGNRDANLVNQNLISTGVFTSADRYNPEGAFTVGANNTLQGVLWILKNGQLGTGPTLGTASYQVYDKTGLPVVGMSEIGITADANGQFNITPVPSLLNLTLDHYLVKLDIVMDSAVRSDYVPLTDPPPIYDLDGVFGLNVSNQLEASFWAKSNEQVITNPARLGTASYEIYDRLGNLVSGMSQTGIIADANGLYKITPVTSTLQTDLTFYSVKIVITLDGLARSEFLPIQGKIPKYASRGIFSINALNQFQGSLWAEADEKARTTGLGTANYTVYDKDGNAVLGLTQSGITADVNGRYHIAPVSAALLIDLTHFNVKIGIVVDGIERVSYRGFTLLGN